MRMEVWQTEAPEGPLVPERLTMRLAIDSARKLLLDQDNPLAGQGTKSILSNIEILRENLKDLSELIDHLADPVDINVCIIAMKECVGEISYVSLDCENMEATQRVEDITRLLRGPIESLKSACITNY